MRIQNVLVALVALGCCLGASGLTAVTHVLGEDVEPSTQQITDAVQAIEALGNDLQDPDGEQTGTTTVTEKLASEIAREREILLKVVAAKNEAAKRNKKALIGVSAVAGALVLLFALLGGRQLYKRRKEASEVELPPSSESPSEPFWKNIRWPFSRKATVEQSV